jgi:hypothetical protein
MNSITSSQSSSAISKIFMCLLMGTLVSCLGGQQLRAGYDYNHKGDFRKYKTFGLMHRTLISDTSIANHEIEDAIISRMKFLGYEENSLSPHLIVSCKLFTDSVRLPVYSQPGVRQMQRSSGNYPIDAGRRYFLRLKPGTLLIQLFDPKLKQTVWQGYSTIPSGARGGEKGWQLRRAVFSILDNYGVWANGFIERRIRVLPLRENLGMPSSNQTK